MKKMLLGLLFLPIIVGAQQSFNMSLLSNFDLPGLPMRYGAEYSDCWGYTHSNGTEVAILAGIEDIFFVNVTNPGNPVLIYTHEVMNVNGSVNQSLWRDFKTYQHYAYAAADEGDTGLLIFDLSQVPTSISVVTQTNASWSRAHTIYIDELNGRLYAAGSNTQSNGLKILDLAANPINPPEIGAIPLNTYGGGYVHALYVSDHIAYCSHGSLHKLQMYNMQNLSNISVVGVIDQYPEEGYNHSSWVNEAGNLLVMADETHGSDLKLVDITDPMNISADDIHTFYSELEGPGVPGASVAHNPYIKGDLAYISYYQDGVQVFDITDPANIEVLAYYDTYPENVDYVGFDGCWGVYPFFPSGIIIGSDQNNGLFILEIANEPLDIDFLSFNARKKDVDVNLEWTVANASFGNRFEVKKSIDFGKTFQTIGTVKLNETETHYSFLDKAVTNGRTYLYRIDFIELDGNKINSPVRSYSSAGEQTSRKLQVTNPASSQLIITPLESMEQLDIVIYDLDGRIILTHHVHEIKAQFELGIEELITGNYLLSMTWPIGAENQMIQVIK